MLFREGNCVNTCYLAVNSFLVSKIQSPELQRSVMMRIRKCLITLSSAEHSCLLSAIYGGTLRHPPTYTQYVPSPHLHPLPSSLPLCPSGHVRSDFQQGHYFRPRKANELGKQHFQISERDPGNVYSAACWVEY